MIILVDVDDVLADFMSPFLSLIEEVTGVVVDMEKANQWRIEKQFLNKDQQKLLFKVLEDRPEIILNLEILPGVEQALKELRVIGEVIAVTAIGPAWIKERAIWLEKLGFNESTRIFAEPKHLIKGDVFIDDKPDNVDLWVKNNPEGLAFLWERPNTKTIPTLGRRSHSWEEIIDDILIKMCDKNRKY